MRTHRSRVAGLQVVPPGPRRPHAKGLLRLIWSERTISRAEIARRTELSRSTVSETVSELLATGLVVEAGPGQSSGGRRPIVLQFQDDAFGLVGVDLGSSHVGVALTDLRGKILVWQERNHPVSTDPVGTRALIAELIDLCLEHWGKGPDRLVGIGVAVPSPVDPRNPDALSEIALPAWKGKAGLAFLADRYGVPMLLDNNANLGALAEHWWGAAQGIDDVAYVKIGTGIGSGHIVAGRLYRGANGAAGEIGHIAMDPQGAPCTCGLRGCLCTLVGAHPLVLRATALRAEHPDSRLGSGEISLSAIEEAALAGDALANQLVREAAGHLAVAIANMLNVLNPTMVIIGGGLSRVGELLLAPLRSAVRSRAVIWSAASAQIVTSPLGPRAVALGAATLALESALADLKRFPFARAMRAV